MASQMSTPASVKGENTENTASRARGCAGLFFFLALIAAAGWGAVLGVFVWILEDAEEPIQAIDEFRPRIGSRVFSFDGELLGEFAVEARRLVSLNEIPVMLQKAFIATEDDTFYEHKGFRPLALANAMVEAIRTNRLRGASTITQQVVRNVDKTGVSREITLRRKFREIIIALQLEREFTKDEILEIYLNQSFLGVSAYGVAAAADQYFAKDVSELTLGECALLAGLTRAPNRNEPFRNPENARIRRDIVLKQMLQNRFITQQDYEEGLKESVDESVVTREERKALAAEGKDSWTPNRFLAPYFVEEVRRFIGKPPAPYEVSASKEELFEGGLEIYTTIDMRLQRIAEDILTKALDEFDAAKRQALEKKGKENEFVPVSGALVCLDNQPGSEGFVRAMVGGRDFETKKFNMATQAERQPGSSVKPFIWLAALDQGMTPSDIVLDAEFIQLDAYGGPWAPENFDRKFLGYIPIRKALERSVNIVSVKLVNRFKMPLVRSYLRSAGFKKPIGDDVGLTIALGTPETTVLDQAVCYSTLALGGVRVQPTIITEIKDRDGFVRYDHRSFRKKTRAFPEDVTYQIIHLLQGVCKPDFKGNYLPTGWRTYKLERPHGGKTGTTNESRNVWFCGFTPQYTCVIWLGYEDNRPLGRGTRYTGGVLASPIWTDFMIQAHEGLPIKDFRVPPGVEFYDIDRHTGLAGGTYREVFIRGTHPPTEMPVLEMTERLEELPKAR